jgi:hypothetical protein
MDFINRAARNLALGQAKSSIDKAYKDGRLIFRENGLVEYTDKKNITTLRPLDDIASLIWDRLEASFQGKASLSMVDITPENIKTIIQEIKEKNETGR